jgi:exo-beta-1,3-glucanase (GH17 family)
MLKFCLLYGLLIYLSITLTSCGLQQAKDYKVNQVGNNKIAAQILGDTNLLAICYGGYRTNTRDAEPSITQIKEDLKILRAMGIKLLRTYNTKYLEASNLLQAISELQTEDSTMEMYVMLGAWIDCENAWTTALPKHDKENEIANNNEIKRAVELANKYPQIVKMISVGNEAMVKWAISYFVTPNIILKWVNHLQQVKKQNGLPKDIWITSSDNFASWGGGDTTYHVEDLNKLYQAVDFVSLHTYPMHDTHYNPVFWKVSEEEKTLSNEVKIDSLMSRSLNYAKAQYLSVYHYMKSIGVDKPIHIGETGWASNDDGFYGKIGSKACDEFKSAKYYHLMREWTTKEKITCFYFEAFDEKWKDKTNPNGSENHFGLFTVDGKAKYAIWDKVDQGVFKTLTRDGKPIVKTHQGKKEKLLKMVVLPSHQTNY